MSPWASSLLNECLGYGILTRGLTSLNLCYKVFFNNFFPYSYCCFICLLQVCEGENLVKIEVSPPRLLLAFVFYMKFCLLLILLFPFYFTSYFISTQIVFVGIPKCFVCLPCKVFQDNFEVRRIVLFWFWNFFVIKKKEIWVAWEVLIILNFVLSQFLFCHGHISWDCWSFQVFFVWIVL